LSCESRVGDVGLLYSLRETNTVSAEAATFQVVQPAHLLIGGLRDHPGGVPRRKVDSDAPAHPYQLAGVLGESQRVRGGVRWPTA